MKVVYIAGGLALTAVLVLVAMALRYEPPPVEVTAAPPRAAAPVQEQLPEPEPPPAPEPAAQPEVEAPGEPEVREIADEIDLAMLLREVGMDRLESRMAQWGVARGYPQLNEMGQFVYDQPYDQYDTETLRGLAEGDDMWAQQILAARLAKTDPAEAIEWYRRAAVNGSVHAMTELAGLYRMIDDRRHENEFTQGEEALEQVYALRDSAVSPKVTGYAWVAVAEKAGWDPLVGSIAASQVARKLSDEQMAEACELANSLYDSVISDRSSAGLGDFNREPPPLVYQPGDAGMGTQCYDPSGGSQYDMSGCREVRVMAGGEAGTTVWFCDEDT